MKYIFLLFLGLFVKLLYAQSDSLQHVVLNRQNASYQQDKPYVILISADGFRYDLATRYKAKNLLRLAREGVWADAMLPSFPSITFPNHYSLITGLYPSHHGLIDNIFWDKQRQQNYHISDKSTVTDGSWYGGVPLWSLAEREHLLSASLFWVGSESDAGGLRPTYYYDYTDKFSIDNKVKIVTDWLQLPSEKRPHFITFYFPEVDHALHMHAVDSPEGKSAVQFVDEGVGKLVKAVSTLGLQNVNFVFVSDHGMMSVNGEIDLSTILTEPATTYKVVNSLVLLHLYVKDSQRILSVCNDLKSKEKDFKVYLKKDIPKHLHFSDKDDIWNRIGDIVMIPEAGKIFIENAQVFNPKVGKHGYDPYKVPEMRATFMAWGAQIQSKKRIPMFENVHVYPFIARILGLHISNRIDGEIDVLEPVLR